jgi:hypothetical protein
MTLLYFDGFETYGLGEDFINEAQDVYNSGEVLANIGDGTFLASDRIPTGQLLQFNTGSVADGNSSFGRSIFAPVAGYADGDTWITGIAFRAPTGYSGDGGFYRVFDWRDLHSNHMVTLRIATSTGDLQLCYESPPTIPNEPAHYLGIAPNGVPEDNGWHYIELKVKFATGTDGTYDVKVDGTSLLSSSAADTTLSTRTRPGHVRMGHMTNKVIQIDDFYVCDDQGDSPWNDFLNTSTVAGGNVRVARTRPEAKVTGEEDFTREPDTGEENWEDVVEDKEDGDTSYVESSTTGHRDIYEYEDIDPLEVGTIYGVIAKPVMKKSDCGSRTYKLLCTSNGTEVDSGERYPPSVGTYVRNTYIWPSNPDALLPADTLWTAGTFNEAQFGLEIVS